MKHQQVLSAVNQRLKVEAAKRLPLDTLQARRDDMAAELALIDNVIAVIKSVHKAVFTTLKASMIPVHGYIESFQGAYWVTYEDPAKVQAFFEQKYGCKFSVPTMRNKRDMTYAENSKINGMTCGVSIQKIKDRVMFTIEDFGL